LNPVKTNFKIVDIVVTCGTLELRIPKGENFVGEKKTEWILFRHQ
jgi:hypothetical protein